MPQPIENNADVLIVGAGPVGLTMACELFRRGIRCRIIDQYGEFPTTSRALGFQARTIEVFQFMGIADTIVANSIVDLGLTVREGNRVLLSMRLDQPPRPDRPYSGVWVQNQAVTERLLRGRLAELGGSVEQSTEFVDFREVNDGIIATVKHTSTGEMEEVRASYLAGCDGAHSTVRQALGLQLEGKTYEEHLALGDVEMDTDMPHNMSVFWLNKEGMFGAIPFEGPTHWRLFAVVTPNQAGEVPQASLELFRRLLVERAGDTTTRVRDPIWFSNFSVHRRMVPHYRKGHAFLAGDAAHIHSPSGGQGMNTGIQDAFNVAWKMALVVRAKASPELLDTYEEERLPVAKFVLNETDANFKAVWSQSPIFQFIRDHVLFRIMSMPGVMEFIFYRGSELNIHYRGSSLAQEHPALPALVGGDEDEKPGLGEWLSFHQAPRPGDRAPDSPLRTSADEPTTIFTQLRTTRFTLLLFAGATLNGDEYKHLALIGNRIRQMYGDQIQTHVVVSKAGSSALPDGDGLMLLDSESQAHKIYGARAESLYLIRPDGYIGFRSQPAEEKPLLDYLDKVIRLTTAAAL